MIRLKNVCLNYDGGPNILDNIDLALDEGSFHFLTGPSGAGKTSLLKLIFLAHRPSAGRLDLFGQDVQKLSRGQLALMRRQIGVVFQDFRLIDHLTVYENVTLPLRIAGKREADYRDNVTELLRWVGLGHQMDSRPETLSGGEKQRAAIARAVIARPRLIVADEPTGNVDPEMGIRLLRLLDELNKMGTTVLIATHDNYIWSNFNHPRLHLEDQHIQRLPPEQLVDV
ncbi:MAG: cell division ATP-binding protein FtsE [Rhizobiales bacterium TMED143]|nr:cell division ATP-binding protein FtsE [Rhodobiaceae bacterium]OUV92238.1 MAG: cell division ATP-binding protein FtsE [Rhizobiales bacterium TMED143]CAI8321573.1 MAG: Cell division ATP-binding protein FtsE [Rhodobiaceae bacterium UBA7378]